MWEKMRRRKNNANSK